MSKKILSLQKVTKCYQSKKALREVSLDIYEGEIMSLLGANGAGKTTLSSILATLHPLTSGDVLYCGTSIYTHITDFRMRFGYCPQKPNLHPLLTLEQNLDYAGRFYGLSKQKRAERISLLSHELELSSFMHEKAEVLSGGYKQRFMIARSLIHEPEFLILDEPTVGLDPHIRRNVWEIIKNLKKSGMTVLITTHYLDEAEKLSDRVCILDKGEIKLVDTPDKLMSDFKQSNLEDVFVELMKGSTNE